MVVQVVEAVQEHVEAAVQLTVQVIALAIVPAGITQKNIEIA